MFVNSVKLNVCKQLMLLALKFSALCINKFDIAIS